jgi:hypothetical protein
MEHGKNNVSTWVKKGHMTNSPEVEEEEGTELGNRHREGNDKVIEST